MQTLRHAQLDVGAASAAGRSAAASRRAPKPASARLPATALQRRLWPIPPPPMDPRRRLRLLLSSAAAPRGAAVIAAALASYDEDEDKDDVADDDEGEESDEDYAAADDTDDDEDEEERRSLPDENLLLATLTSPATTLTPTGEPLFPDHDDGDAELLDFATGAPEEPLFHVSAEDDPIRPWEAELPTVDQVVEDPNWPSLVASWPRFWALYGLWRHHLFLREHLPPSTKEEKRNPRARRGALWERALRLAPADGAEDISVLFARGAWDDGSSSSEGGEKGSGGGVSGSSSGEEEGGGGDGESAGESSSGGFGENSDDSARDEEEEEKAARAALRARNQAREAALLNALPAMAKPDVKAWREHAELRDKKIFVAVCTVNKALPGLLRAKVPVPEWVHNVFKAPRVPLLPGDRALGGVRVPGVMVKWKEPRDLAVLPTYRTGGKVGGSNAFPGPRAPSGLERWSRTELTKRDADLASRGDPSGSGFSRRDMEEEEIARRSSGFADGVIQHAWSTWGDGELRAWNEKRRQHARADAAFAKRQAELVGRAKGYNVDEITDVRLGRKVVGLIPEFKLTWTHEEIMDVITNYGQNAHPDVASPALGVGDMARNLDYWEEGFHVGLDIVSGVQASGRMVDDETMLPDLDELVWEMDEEGDGGEGGGGADVFGDDGDDEEEGEAEPGRGGSNGVGGKVIDVEEASTVRAAAAKASSSSAASTTLPFPTAAAASADLAETFAGLDEMASAAGTGGNSSEGEEEEDDIDEIGIIGIEDSIEEDEDEEEPGSDEDELGGIPGLDSDPEFDEVSF